ncbi:MAG TPA: LppX_LprAFG lipoprotein [Chloroflexia bacterium]|nr:LppX_LprAFG lipoprotein [Chloroflexia bacterium]
MAIALVAMGLSGCGEDEKLPAISADEVIKKSSLAIQAPKSFHFSLSTENMHTLPGLWLTKADGDALKPDKMLGKVTARRSGFTFTAEVVVDGKNQWWTDPLSGRWEPMPAYFDVSQLFNPAKGAADILSSVKGLSSDGDEKIVDVVSYRIKGEVPPDSLRALTPEVNVKTNIPATLWVGGRDFLLRRVRLQGALIEGEPSEVVRIITISDYDKEVKIETPVVK